jgi:hypothetical protein
MMLSLRQAAAGAALLGSLFLTNAGYSQAAQDPAPSSMVSPPASGIELERVEPAKPKPADEALDSAIAVDPASLIPDPPPLPHRNATLVGGTLVRLDRVRDQVTVQVFGGGRTTALFDPRTRVYRGSKEVTIADLREGERIYLDTILDGSSVFARSIRLNANSALGESQGVVLRYRAERGELTIRDGIAPNAVEVRLTSSTKFVQGERTVPASTLVAGSLVAVSFSAEGNGHDVARQISILALPGTRYTFAGEIVHIDLRSGLLVLNSSIDHKTYEIYLDPSVAPDDNLHPGTTVTITANFQDSRYVARSLTVNSQGK